MLKEQKPPVQSIDDPCPFGKCLKQSYHQLNLSRPWREILNLSTSHGLIDKNAQNPTSISQ